jgi:hypothetical protein
MNIRGWVNVWVGARCVFSDHNLLTNAGLAHMAGLLNGSQTTPLKYVALGTGVTPEDAADTALGNEKLDDGAGRVLAQTLDRITTTLTDDTTRVVATFAITDNFSLSEIGLLSAVAGGVLGAHRVFSPVAVLSGQTVVITWTLALAEGA